jgi:hypothetical protein
MGEFVRGKEMNALIAVFIVAVVGIGFDRILGADTDYIGLFVGCVFAAVVTGIVAEDGGAFALLFGLFAVASLVAEVVRQFRTIGWAAASGIDLAVVLVAWVIGWYLLFERHRRAARRLLARTSPALAWQVRSPDRDVLRRVRQAYPEVRDRTRTLYATADTTVDGVPLTLVSGRRADQVWLSRLPVSLPQVMLRQPAQDVDLGVHPAAERALRTPEVAAMADGPHILDCRIERDDLVVRFPAAKDAAQLADDARTVAALARALPIDAARPYSVEPALLPDPLPQRAQRAKAARQANVRVTAGTTMIFAALAIICGGWNVSYPGHRTGSYVLIAVGLSAIGLAGLAWIAFGRRTDLDRARASTAARRK